MAILKIRDANGNIQEILAIKGEDGKDYVLTDADKQEIAAIVSGGVSVDLSGYARFKKVTDEEVNNREWTDETARTVMYWEPESDELFWWALVFSFGNDIRGLENQVAIGNDGTIYERNADDNFAEWKEVFCKISQLESIRDFVETALENMDAKFDDYVTEARVLELIQANMPTSGDEVSY